MSNLNKKKTDHCFSIRVYMEDTDLQGIVYHANYLYFFERARTELLREYGFTLTAMAKYDTNFAIKDIHLHFLFPAQLDDLLKIETRCQRKKNCSLRFNQAMFNQSGQLLCEANIDVVCVNKQLKPIRLPEALISAIERTITLEDKT